MSGRWIVALLLFAGSEAAAAKTVRLPGGERARVVDRHQLEIRRGGERVTLSLPNDVSDIERLEPGDPITFFLERICPPPFLLTLTRRELDARFLFARAEERLRKGQRAPAMESLRQALALAPHETEVRLAIARAELDDKAEAAAIETLRAGLAVRPLETYWRVLGDSRLSALSAQLGLPQQPAGLTHGTGFPGFTAWSAERKWFATGGEGIQVLDLDGRVVFSADVVDPGDLDESGELLPRARGRMKKASIRIDRLLGAFGFRAVDPAGRVEPEISADWELSWLRWKQRDLVASAGSGGMIRVRLHGKAIFERHVETMGAIRFDEGQLVTEASALLLSWYRFAGNDECPNAAGLEVVKLPRP